MIANVLILDYDHINHEVLGVFLNYEDAINYINNYKLSGEVGFYIEKYDMLTGKSIKLIRLNQ